MSPPFTGHTPTDAPDMFMAEFASEATISNGEDDNRNHDEIHSSSDFDTSGFGTADNPIKPFIYSNPPSPVLWTLLAIDRASTNGTTNLEHDNLATKRSS